MDTQDFDRLTLLERAQLLHDSTLIRHGDVLESHAQRLTRLDEIVDQQKRILALLADVQVRMETTLTAIKDLLERGNGHSGS